MEINPRLAARSHAPAWERTACHAPASLTCVPQPGPTQERRKWCVPTQERGNEAFEPPKANVDGKREHHYCAQFPGSFPRSCVGTHCLRRSGVADMCAPAGPTQERRKWCVPTQERGNEAFGPPRPTSTANANTTIARIRRGVW